MNSGREREMAVRLAVDIEKIGILELRRIAVRGPDADVNVAPRRNVDSAEPRVPRRPPVAELVRAFHAQEFLDRGAGALGMLAQVPRRVRVADQEVDAVADQIRRGLVAGIEQKDAIVQELDLAQPLP